MCVFVYMLYNIDQRVLCVVVRQVKVVLRVNDTTDAIFKLMEQGLQSFLSLSPLPLPLHYLPLQVKAKAQQEQSELEEVVN